MYRHIIGPMKRPTTQNSIVSSVIRGNYDALYSLQNAQWVSRPDQSRKKIVEQNTA